jgi:predicted Zn-dependent protease
VGLEEIQPTLKEIRVILELGYFLRDIARYDEAEELFQGLIILLPTHDLPRVALSTIELRRGRVNRAEQICLETLELYPDSLYARIHRAVALLFLRRSIEAEAILREVIELDSESPHSRTAINLLELINSVYHYKER